MPDDPNDPSPPPWESGRHTWFDPPHPRVAPDDEDPSGDTALGRFRVAPVSPGAGRAEPPLSSGRGGPPPVLPADPRLPRPARPVQGGPRPAVARASVRPPQPPGRPTGPAGDAGPISGPADRAGPIAGQAPPPAVAIQWSPQPGARPASPPPGAGAPAALRPSPVPPAAPPDAPAREDSAGWAWLLLVAACVFLASSGWFAYQRMQADPGDPAGAAPGTAASPSAAAWPPCAEIFAPGRVIEEEQALAPCRDPDGGLKAVGNFRCTDGRRLFQVDANTGAPAGWGFGGTAFQETADAASDPAYAAAYRECTG